MAKNITRPPIGMFGGRVIFSSPHLSEVSPRRIRRAGKDNEVRDLHLSSGRSNPCRAAAGDLRNGEATSLKIAGLIALDADNLSRRIPSGERFRLPSRRSSSYFQFEISFDTFFRVILGLIFKPNSKI